MKTIFSVALAAVLAASMSPMTSSQKTAIAGSSESAILASDADISSAAVMVPDVEEPLYPELDFTGVAPNEVEFIKGVLAAETAANLRGRLGGSENEAGESEGSCFAKHCSKRYDYVNNCCQDELEDLSGDMGKDGDFVCIQKWGSAPANSVSGHWGCGDLLTCYGYGGHDLKYGDKCSQRSKL